MSEPGAGSDVRGMSCRAVRDGDDFVINGTKHFISHADLADYTILFAATGEEETPRGPKKLITSFLVDHDTPGLELAPGYESVSNRGYHNLILNFDDCRVPASKVLGEQDRGFDVANEWLGSTRLQVASVCLGRADRAMSVALDWAASREQFGQKIGKFQGVSFKLADMRTAMIAAELMTYRAAWLMDRGTMSDGDAAMAKISSTEMLQFVSDEAIQILGGYGYTRDYPVEQYWRDNRLNMIHEGTHGIQGLDLLGRKVVMNGGKALSVLAERISETIQKAGHVDGLAGHANALAQALQKVGATTKAAWSTGVPEEALANATPFLQAFGHTVLAWVWLELALAAKAAQAQGTWDASPLGPGFLQGKLACADYFFAYELPKTDAWLGVVARRDLTCAQAQADWF